MLIQRINGVRTTAESAAPAAKDVAAVVADSPGSGKLAASAVAQAAATPTVDELKLAVNQGNRAMAAMSASLTFEVDADTKVTVVKIVDTADNRVLRQIPSQEMLDIAKALDRLQGLLVRDKA